MTAVTFSLLAVLFLSPGIDGIRIRAACVDSTQFRCDNGICLYKHQWCDGSRTCGDGSDEKYCNSAAICDSQIHFQCENRQMCIPIQGRCDGYSSCPDESDEKGCPCEELIEEEGNFEYEAYIGSYRTQQKCWKISIQPGQYVELDISGTVYKRDCELGNVTVFSAAKDDADEDEVLRVMCAEYFATMDVGHVRISPIERNFSLYEDTVIQYSSNYYERSSHSQKDFLKITYKKVDTMCKQPDMFTCTRGSCISAEKKCDGIKDCPNGLDEYKCDYGAFSSAYFETSRKKAVQWMKNQHNANWAWKQNTHRAAVALHLADGLNSNDSNNEEDLIAKQLELEVSTFLLRSKTDKRSTAELSAYVNALLVICHDPRKFYGFDLVAALRKELNAVSEFEPPFPYLTLCNAKEPISQDEIDHLFKMLQNPPTHGFVLEIQALAIMALSCAINNNHQYGRAINNNHQYANLKQNITDALDSLKKEQMPDGSFGNTYTTALVLQALIANNQEIVKDWNISSAVQFLKQKQADNGSFDDFLATYLVLPLLNNKSLLDVGKINCTEAQRRPKDGGIVSDIKSRLGGKTVVKYSLFIGNEKDQIHPISLRTHENITVLELMLLAADIDPKYKFQTQKIKNETFVYEISNIPNDPESNTFWFMYQGTVNGTVPISEQSPDKVKVHQKEHIIMWYKTLNSM